MCDTKGKVHQTETDFRFSQKSAQDEDSQNYHLLANKVSNHKCIHAWKTIANIGPAHISDQHEVHFGQQQWHFYSASSPNPGSLAQVQQVGVTAHVA
jgi:hypothetical protein